MSNQTLFDLSVPDLAERKPVRSHLFMYQSVIAHTFYEIDMERNGEKKTIKTPCEIPGLVQFVRDDGQVTVSHKVRDMPKALKPDTTCPFVYRDYKPEELTIA